MALYIKQIRKIIFQWFYESIEYAAIYSLKSPLGKAAGMMIEISILIQTDPRKRVAQ
jgi:hypothetical protein